MDETQRISRFLECASAAASQAATDIMDNIELGQGENLDKYKLIPRCILIEQSDSLLIGFFKTHGKKEIKRSGTVYGEYYVYRDAYIVKWPDDVHYRLRIEYSFFEKDQDPVVKKAYDAILYVLLQLDDKLTVEVI